MELTFVSSNPGKLREMRELCLPYGVTVRGLRRVLVEPQADDLETVARAKLAQTRGLRNAVLVEDSGLFIDALGGFPGVYSAHIYRLWKWDPILRLLRAQPRGARFRCVAAARRGSRVFVGSGVCEGTIARAARGRRGFGFDPIFIPVGETRTFAELSDEEKGRFSHRGRAVRALMARMGIRRSA